MDYHLLTDAQRAQIAQQKLLDLEAEHARLELDVRLALATGVQNENVAQAQGHLDILAAQRAVLMSWITPPSADEPAPPAPEPSNNGRKAKV